MDALWSLLSDGRCAVGDIPPERWDVDRYYDADPDAPGKMYTRRGAFLRDVDLFDANLFGVSPREAAPMDPQHRLLLETTWRAIEHAGRDPRTLAGAAVGVFAAVGFEDYARRCLYATDTTLIDAYSALGNSRSVAAGRLAYALDLRGPVVQLDTTCSSSLLAIHLACQSLRHRECDAALAGGVNLILAPEPMIAFCKLRALAPDGLSKAFDAAADGYGRGEGCGVVLLKRLSDALTDGDPILAVVRGSAVNHDGRSNGLTAPNGAAQEALLRQALCNAGVSARDVAYVETHGTGTPLGDPIELHALATVLCSPSDREQPLIVGSVKTNLGHLEAAAGVAGFVKAALSIANGRIPGHLHLHHPSPRIPWARLRLAANTLAMPWPVDPVGETSGLRTAGISSFGMSGTNVHVVLSSVADVPAPRAVPQYREFQRKRYWIDSPDAGAGFRSRSAETTRVASRGDSDGAHAACNGSVGVRNSAGATLADLRVHAARILNCDPTEIVADRPLIEQGFDSLMLVELATVLQREYAFRLEAVALTPELSLAAIAPKSSCAGGNSSGVPDAQENRAPQWVIDAALGSTIRTSDHFRRDPNDRTAVLLTGATGYLGSFVLHELMEQTDAQVHCLVRATSEVNALQRLRRALEEKGIWNGRYAERLRVWLSDLSRPNLGLTAEQLDRLSGQIDAIYHNAAMLSYVAPYSTLRAVNVMSTLEILRLATRGPSAVPVYHVSSVGALESSAYRGRRIRETTLVDRWEDIPIGYSQSKWAAERMVALARGGGLTASIFRPPLLCGHSDTGVWDAENILSRVIAGSIRLGCVPGDLSIVLDVSPVDYVSKAIVHLSLCLDAQNRSFHLQNPRPIAWSEFLGFVRKLRNDVIETTFAEWRDRILTDSDNPLYPLSPLFCQPVTPDGRTYIELLAPSSRPIIDCSQTVALLAEAGITHPPMTHSAFSGPLR